MISQDAPVRSEETLTPAVVGDLVEHYTALWWASDTSLPRIGPIYSPRIQSANERHLDVFLAALADDLSARPRDEHEHQARQERVRCKARSAYPEPCLKHET